MRDLILPTQLPNHQILETHNDHPPSPELSTAEQSAQNSKLEKLVYKVSGDFRAKILREKNAKLWTKLSNFTLAEIEFLLNSEGRKAERAARFEELETEKKENETRIVECLENDLTDEADQISAELERIEGSRQVIEKQRIQDDFRQETFLENGELILNLTNSGVYT